jgi:hypothetical protein
VPFAKQCTAYYEAMHRLYEAMHRLYEAMHRAGGILGNLAIVQEHSLKGSDQKPQGSPEVDDRLKLIPHNALDRRL